MNTTKIHAEPVKVICLFFMILFNLANFTSKSFANPSSHLSPPGITITPIKPKIPRMDPERAILELNKTWTAEGDSIWYPNRDSTQKALRKIVELSASIRGREEILDFDSPPKLYKIRGSNIFRFLILDENVKKIISKGCIS